LEKRCRYAVPARTVTKYPGFATIDILLEIHASPTELMSTMAIHYIASIP